jgi:hypothetical protein
MQIQMKRLFTGFCLTMLSLAGISAFSGRKHTSTESINTSSTDKIPLNDLGTFYWRGQQGGLYPHGLNTRPTAHANAGLKFASEIKPLDENGNPDSTNGKIVLLIIGMSNTTQIASAFIPTTNAFSTKNQKLVLVDGAQGGWDIDRINDPNATFWTNIATRLAAKGVTPKQVQAFWFLEADKRFPDTSFMGYVSNFKNKLKTSMRILKSKYSNANLCYITSRIYSGYQHDNSHNPEPFAYYTGWAVKSLIEEQINGDPDLAYSGSIAKVPWLSWAAYTWANGAEPRKDGLKWIYPEDYRKDGIHPSITGAQKVANMLLQFFTTDPTTTPWFIK